MPPRDDGDRAAYLEQARRAIAALPETRVLAASAIEETPPIGPAGQGPYLNQMLAVETWLAGASGAAPAYLEWEQRKQERLLAA